MAMCALRGINAVLLACLILCGEVTKVTARSLRLQKQPQRVLRADVQNATVSALAVQAIGDDDLVLQVTKKTSLESEDSSECLCKLGTFWHWRIHQCVKQGSWGYECGFFPAEHWHRVCQDNLKCEELEGAEDNYHSHGKFKGTADSKPASCKTCTKEDECKVGEARHEEDCIKQYSLSGEACATVKVTLPMTAEATATKEVKVKVTESKNASAKATATASHKAEVTATAKDTAKPEGKEAVEVEAKATAQATAEKEATAEATETVEATKSATGSSTVTKTSKKQGVAEETACVSAEEVMKEMGLDPKQKVGAVLSAQIVSKADEMAFEKASAAATAAAKAAGLLDAREAAKQLAEAEAAEEARLKAEALARKAAAWEAEAGADKAAKAAAQARAKEIAKESAKLEAERLAHLKAEAAAAKAAAEKAEAAAKAAEEAAANAEGEAAAKLKQKADAAAAEAAAADAAADAAAQAQKDLEDVLNTRNKQADEVPRTEPTEPPAYRKITDEEMEEKLP